MSPLRRELNYRDLTAAEKSRLWQGFVAGDTESRRRLLCLNEPLVRAVAARYGGGEDLLQAGRLGLLTAMERFDPTRNVPFGAYAFGYIKGEVIAAVAAARGHKKNAAGPGPPRYISLEQLVAAGEEAALADGAATAMMERVEERLALRDAAIGLDPEERRLLYLRYVGGRSQKATGEALSLSQTRISRKEKEILAKLRGML